MQHEPCSMLGHVGTCLGKEGHQVRVHARLHKSTVGIELPGLPNERLGDLGGRGDERACDGSLLHLADAICTRLICVAIWFRVCLAATSGERRRSG